MKFEKFEEIIVWQKARTFVKNIYATFKDCRDFSFKDQIQRAALSIMNNISEGFERQTNSEFKRFLFFSKGSAGETRSMLYVATDLNYIDESTFKFLHTDATEIAKMLSGLIKSLS